MNEEQIRRRLKETMHEKSREGPGFGDSWLAAEARYLDERRRTRQVGGLVAVVAMLAVTFSLIPGEQETPLPDIVVGDELLSSTLWSAPSDVLIPRHEIDLYRDIPTLIESTDLQEGTLL